MIEDARARGIPFGLEHTNSLRVDVGFVHTLRDVVDLARRLDIGVCVELNACWAERGLAETIRDAVDTFRIVQVSDFAIGTLSTPNRLVPGDGDIPLERILGQVLAAGYEGCFDLELIGPRIDEEGYASACRRDRQRVTCSTRFASISTLGALRPAWCQASHCTGPRWNEHFASRRSSPPGHRELSSGSAPSKPGFRSSRSHASGCVGRRALAPRAHHSPRPRLASSQASTAT